MSSEIPEYVLLLESVLRPFVMTIALGLIWLGAAGMPVSAKSRYTTAIVLSAALLGWEAVAQYFGEANTYLATIENPPVVPTILFGLLAPLAVATIALWQSESVARLVSAIPLQWLVAAQVYRVAGGIFLVLWAGGRMPWQFALPAGIGDIATGILAVIVAVQLGRNSIGAQRATYVWCLFGIADLVLAIAMGALTAPGRVHLLALEAPNLLVTAYPLVMVPTFAVPLALMLHGLVLLRLQRGATSTRQLAAAVKPLASSNAQGGRPYCRPQLCSARLPQ
jgi:hypothetical protein